MHDNGAYENQLAHAANHTSVRVSGQCHLRKWKDEINHGPRGAWLPRRPAAAGEYTK